MSEPDETGELDFEEVQKLFEAALDHPVDHRRSFLDQLGLEPRLHDEVWSLVEAHRAGGALDDVAAALASITDHRQGGEEDGGDSLAHPTRVGPYRVHEAVGKGGMATVYRGKRADDPEAPWVALKVLRPEADSDRVRRRFMTERQILSRLDHDNIARFLDDGLTSDGLPYLVTEFVEGDRLDRFCDRNDVDLAGRLDLFLQVCRAVEYAHGQGVAHRDLKPDNVLVTAEGDLKLLDFGIAKILDKSAFPGIGKPTTTGVHVLTLSYASPEQLRGDPITPASDVYQLGLLLVKIVTGRVPAIHERTADPAVIDLAPRGSSTKSTEEEANPGADVLARLRPTVLGTLHLRPEDRQASVGDVIREVEGVLAHQGMAHPGPGTPGGIPARARTMVPLLLGILAVAVLVVAVLARSG